MPQPNPPNHPKPNNPQNRGHQNNQPPDRANSADGEIIDRIEKLTNFSNYDIRTLVKDAEKMGNTLKAGKLETNQVRKFLDAINRIKAQVLDEIDETISDEQRFDKIKVDIVLLKPKLAYAAARQSAAKPLQKVLDIAIDRVQTMTDFERLVQFVESIVAYHKAAGGK